jgi:hypothetical protein
VVEFNYMAKTQPHYFEVYLLEDTMTREQWGKLYSAVLSFAGRLIKFQVVFQCTDNVVRYFIISDYDLSALSNNLDGMLLRAVDADEVVAPTADSKVRFLQFVDGGNLLDLKEKLAVKKSLHLEYATIDVKTLTSTQAFVTSKLYFKNPQGMWSYARKTMNFFPGNLLAIDFSSNTHYLKKAMPRYLDIEKSLHMLTSENMNAIFEVNTFPYLPHNYHLNVTSYEFDKHSFIIGATGSGKSKLISLYVDRLYKTALRQNYRIVIIDPHAALAADLEFMPDSKIINFNNESTGLFPESTTDVSAATELTATLFKSLLADQYAARLDRMLRFSLFVLFTAQNMSLDMLKRFLTEIELRNQVLEHVGPYVPHNIVRYFGTDFNELRTGYYNETILPIVALVDELQLQPALVHGSDVSLAKTVQENFLTVFSLNKVSMGERPVKTIAGLLIQQIFLLAQARTLQQKVILVIDEVSVVQNPALAAILAEARKFNLSVILTQQYFGQIEKNLQDAIFSNVYNYYVFRVSEEDARALEGNLNMELPREIQEIDNKKGLKEADVRVRMLTELHPRECILRLSANGKLTPCVKARTTEAPTFTDGMGGTQAHLREYHTKTQSLPAKFNETAQHTASVSPSAPIASTGSHVPQPKPPEPATRPMPVSTVSVAPNLAQLLSEHSSSRKKVNNKEIQP